MPRAAATEERGMYAIRAAARIGRALQVGPITVAQAGCLVAGAAGLDWERLGEAERKPWRARGMRIIDAISLVGGLPIAEDKIGGKLVFFLLTL